MHTSFDLLVVDNHKYRSHPKRFAPDVQFSMKNNAKWPCNWYHKQFFLLDQRRQSMYEVEKYLTEIMVIWEYEGQMLDFSIKYLKKEENSDKKTSVLEKSILGCVFYTNPLSQFTPRTQNYKIGENHEGRCLWESSKGFHGVLKDTS